MGLGTKLDLEKILGKKVISIFYTSLLLHFNFPIFLSLTNIILNFPCLLAKLRGVPLVLLLPHGRLSPEEIDLGSGREQALVLLPLEGLSEQRQQP